MRNTFSNTRTNARMHSGPSRLPAVSRYRTANVKPCTPLFLWRTAETASLRRQWTVCTWISACGVDGRLVWRIMVEGRVAGRFISGGSIVSAEQWRRTPHTYAVFNSIVGVFASQGFWWSDWCDGRPERSVE